LTVDTCRVITRSIATGARWRAGTPAATVDRPPTMVPWAEIVNLDDQRIVVDAARFAEG
jgi:hypothetical protein